ncbi:MAG: hypothetical protein HON65_15940, partial [Rhodospirillales bacterium]|nr:hypothetical protein [Rhodospirillales bacterium]
MADETPNTPIVTDDNDDDQQTLDDLTVLVDGDEPESLGDGEDAVGGADPAEPEDQMLGTLHTGSQQTTKEIVDNLAPQDPPVVEVPGVEESDRQNRGVTIDGITTQTTDTDVETDADPEPEHSGKGKGGDKDKGPGKKDDGPGKDSDK